MATYSPGNPPSENSQMSEVLNAIYGELRTIAGCINGASPVQSDVLNVEPSKPRDGMIVAADGTNWNPGGGAGFYGRTAGAWVKLG